MSAVRAASAVRSDVAVSLRDVSAGCGPVASLRHLDLEVRAGELVALVGPTGSGRTTALLTMAGLVPHRSGTIELFGTPVGPTRRGRTSRVARARVRRGVSFVPDDRALFPRLTVDEHLELGASARTGWRPGGRRRARAGVDLALIPFPELAGLRGRRAGLLSGGEQQMLALARATAGAPRLLLVDELSAGLAPLVVTRLLGSLRAIANDSGAAVVIVDSASERLLEAVDRRVELPDGPRSRGGGAAT